MLLSPPFFFDVLFFLNFRNFLYFTGELELVKAFQSQVFEQFLHGKSLDECYAAVGAIGNTWLDVLGTLLLLFCLNFSIRLVQYILQFVYFLFSPLLFSSYHLFFFSPFHFLFFSPFILFYPLHFSFHYSNLSLLDRKSVV